MARILREDCTDLYRAIVTYEIGWSDWREPFKPDLDESGMAVRGTTIVGPYDRIGTTQAVAVGVVRKDYSCRRLIETRIQKLTPVAFELVKTDQFGNREISVAAELRWVDV